MEKVYIFGHKKPDTDSVAGAISFAYLKRKLGINAEARILSEVNKETMKLANIKAQSIFISTTKSAEIFNIFPK